jgi:cytochrome d ubiquinol oxidase subunit II
MIDYEFLRVLWWLLLGTLLIGLAVMDGFDLGTAILMPVVGRTDMEHRVVINTVGPVWEGNQVWLILGGGAIFAAWPPLYAVAFSGFYLAMLLLLCALILRPVGFKFRSKLTSPAWHGFWDTMLFLGGLVPALVYGVAFGNALQGVPFRLDDTLRMTYEGGLLGLFNPFALLCGLVSVAMLVLHGGAWLACKTEGVIATRAQSAARKAGIALIVLFALGGIAAAFIPGYEVTHFAGPNAPSNPLAKTVVIQSGALLHNYLRYPWTLLAPLLGFAGAGGALRMLQQRRAILAFVCSGLAIAGVIATAGVSMFPFLLPSSVDPRSSLLVWDASSSETTLAIMTAATLILLPIVLAYTAWVYRVLAGPVTEDDVARDLHTSY